MAHTFLPPSSPLPLADGVSTTSATKTAQVVEPVEVGGNDKLLKSLYKKLKQIEVLKEKQAQGATLEVNQVWSVCREHLSICPGPFSFDNLWDLCMGPQVPKCKRTLFCLTVLWSPNDQGKSPKSNLKSCLSK